MAGICFGGTPREGADTIVWLAAAERIDAVSGTFFFDRRPVSTYLLPRTRESAEDRRRLWRTVSEQAGLGDKAHPPALW